MNVVVLDLDPPMETPVKKVMVLQKGLKLFRPEGGIRIRIRDRGRLDTVFESLRVL